MSLRAHPSLMTPIRKLGLVLGSEECRQRISTTVLRCTPSEHISPLP
jgi:hypothetical protein